MNQELLQWKRKDYFRYAPYEIDEVASEEILEWHDYLYNYFDFLQDKIIESASFEFHGRILSIHYIELENKIFVPGTNTNFARLPQITEEQLPLAIMCGSVYMLNGPWERLFKILIAMEEPKPKPLFNNEYDFRKQIGKTIWKN